MGYGVLQILLLDIMGQVCNSKNENAKIISFICRRLQYNETRVQYDCGRLDIAREPIWSGRELLPEKYQYDAGGTSRGQQSYLVTSARK